ncbi:hypothetical protein FAZ79_01730 [Guyparkeria sp. SB14A]|nr:hypothetical protein FAZ79_01730 [Guyparkeria sp. SB14A]
MTPIAASLPSLAPAPRFMPGGAGGVAPEARPAPSLTSDPSRVRGVDKATEAGSPNRPTTRSPTASEGMSNEEQRVLAELKARDQEVRAHENAHRAAGGDLVRGGSYDYQQGPDGKRYAIGGDVQIDTTPVAGDPRATAEKMAQVIRAALAPAEPSPTDLAVAAQATAERNRAQSEARADNGDSGTDDRSASDKDTSDPTTPYRRAAEPANAGANLDAIA